MISFVEFAPGVGLDLTPAQRAFARVAFDGERVVDLRGEERDFARALFGVDELDVPERARRAVVMLWGRGSGKSRLAQTRLAHLAITLPLELAPGEHTYAITVAPDIRLAQDATVFWHGCAEQIGLQLVQSDADRTTFLRADGRAVVHAVLPATNGGRAIRGRPLVGVHFDEGAFFRDKRYRINFSECYGAAFPRLLPGGQVLTTSTPWAESGGFFDLWQANWTHPRTALAARGPTVLVRPDQAELVELERERDAENAAREFDCVFMSGGAGYLLDPADVAEAIRLGRDPAPEGPATKVGVGADFGFARDSSAIVVVRRDADVIRVVEVLELRPTPSQPLRPSVVCQTFANVARRYGARWIRADRHHLESLDEHVRSAGLRILPCMDSQQAKADAWLRLRQLVREGQIAIPPREKKLLDDLREVVAQPSAGGVVSITQPRGTSGGHGDVGSAFVAAVLDVQHRRASDDPKPRALGHLEMAGYYAPSERPIDRIAERRGWRPIGGPSTGGY